MGIFSDILQSGESLFKNEEALDPDFVPKNLPYRENQHHQIANAIKPLLVGRTGRNLFICGAPGIGKTAAVKWVFRELEEETEDVYPIYINCWNKNTSFQIYSEILQQMGYSFTVNKRTEELLTIIKNMLNVKSAVFCFDEVDKATDYDFLYSLIGEVYKKSIFLITNYPEWLLKLEHRIKSRLVPEVIDFKQYTKEETAGIMQHRIGFAFVPGVWTAPAQSLIVDAAHAKQDVRSGLVLLREAGLNAEGKSSRRITIEHAEAAVKKVNDQIPGSSREEDLDSNLQKILAVIKLNSGLRIGTLFEKYNSDGGEGTYKTFQRRIEKLNKTGFINAKKVTGKEGNTTIVSYGQDKKLSDF